MFYIIIIAITMSYPRHFWGTVFDLFTHMETLTRHIHSVQMQYIMSIWSFMWKLDSGAGGFGFFMSLPFVSIALKNDILLDRQ